MNGSGRTADEIRIRGKVKVARDALLCTALIAALVAPVAWERAASASAPNSDQALLLIGLLALLGAVCVTVWRLLDLWIDRTTPGTEARRAGAAQEADADTAAAPRRSTGTEPAEWAIACSGGGIRSAAFCLGALQRLRRPTTDSTDSRSLYDRSDAVYSVSGGGYIATGLHVARRSSPTAAGDVFMPGSPEEDRLRRNSSYLFSTAKVRTIGILSLLFGLTLNLLLLAATLGLVSWWMAWWLRQDDTLSGFPTPDAVFDVWAAPWWVVGSLVLPVLGVTAFVVRKVIERFARRRTTDTDSGEGTTSRVPAATTRVLDTAAHGLVWAGVAAVLLLLAAPAALPALHDAAVRNEPTVPVAKLITQVGFANTEACTQGARAAFDTARADAEAAGRTTFSYGSCGETASGIPLSVAEACRPTGEDAEPFRCAGLASSAATGGIAAGLALMGTLAGIVRSMLGGRGTTENRRGKALSWLRVRLLPWLGSTVVVAVVGVVFLKWIHDLALHPEAYDQTWLLLSCAGVLVGVKVITNATASSLHPFYRERLSTAFFLRRDARGQAEPVPYDRPTLVSRCGDGPGPALVICAAANATDAEYIPTQRECTPFRFSTGLAADGGDRRGIPAQIGLSDTWRLPGGLCEADTFEVAADRYQRDATLAAAMAISGAAVSPRTGRGNTRSRPYRLLLALANARLGVWLPNPYWVGASGCRSKLSEWSRGSTDNGWVQAALTWLDKPGAFRLAKEVFGSASVFDKRIYVTDGGHYDNTALVEALRDRPRRLVMIDASNDAEGSFSALGEAIATARMDLGLEVAVERIDDKPGLERLRRTNDRPAPRAWARLYARPVGATPDSEPTTTIYLVKAIRYAGLPHDVESYAGEHADFPRTGTGNQLYGEYAFEAYRRLGEVAMSRCVDEYGLETGTSHPLVPTDETRLPRLDRHRHLRVLYPRGRFVAHFTSTAVFRRNGDRV